MAGRYPHRPAAQLIVAALPPGNRGLDRVQRAADLDLELLLPPRAGRIQHAASNAGPGAATAPSSGLATSRTMGTSAC